VSRRRGWRTGLVAVLLVGGVLAVAVLASTVLDRGRPALTVRDADGALLARVPLPADRGFALRYRNSLYGTLAEERFVIAEQGRLRLVELAADQLAVLEEYYAVKEPAMRAPPGSRRVWVAEPAWPVELAELSIAATELGRRTLLVPGRAPLPLWRLVEADPTVVLQFEGAGA
jgi:hypothetical protein